MKKLAFAALAATGLLVLSACAASKISFADWKKKADACEDVAYKTATLKVDVKSDTNGSKDSEKETYTYTYGDNGWVADQEAGATYVMAIGGQAKNSFMTDPNTDDNHVYTFYSDLSVKAHTYDEMSVLGQSMKITSDSKYSFNSNGYVVKVTFKSVVEYETTGVLASLVESGSSTESGSYSISYAK